METAWVSVSGARRGSSSLAGRTPGSLRRASRLRSKGNYLDAVARLEGCGCSREQLLLEKAEVYQRLAEVNRQIRQERQKLAICREIQKETPQMERSIGVFKAESI